MRYEAPGSVGAPSPDPQQRHHGIRAGAAAHHHRQHGLLWPARDGQFPRTRDRAALAGSGEQCASPHGAQPHFYECRWRRTREPRAPCRVDGGHRHRGGCRPRRRGRLRDGARAGTLAHRGIVRAGFRRRQCHALGRCGPRLPLYLEGQEVHRRRDRAGAVLDRPGLFPAAHGACLEPHRHRRLPARSGRHRLHWLPARAPHDARHRGAARGPAAGFAPHREGRLRHAGREPWHG